MTDKTNIWAKATDNRLPWPMDSITQVQPPI